MRKAYHAANSAHTLGALAATLVTTLALSACAKSCEGEAPRTKGAAPVSVAKISCSSPSKAASVERFMARRLRAMDVSFYRVGPRDDGALVEIDQADVARLKADVDGALRVDIYAVDEVARPFAGHEAAAPFPAISRDGELQTPKDHQASLARFVATMASAPGSRILLGGSAGDEFVHTFVVALPAGVGGESIDHVELANRDGMWGANVVLDEAGRVAFTDFTRARIDKRVVVAIDGAVRAVLTVKSAIDDGRMWIALGEGDAGRTDGQRVLDRFRSGARATDLKLLAE